MKPADYSDWIAEHRIKADDSIRVIHAAKKSRVAEYDERLRQLRSFAEQLFIKASDQQQAEMFDPKTVLSPDLTKLLNSPMAGLD